VVDTLTVDLSRETLQDVEPATGAFETSGSFEIEFVNHDRAAHVHVHPDDALARAVEIDETNRYVDTDATEVVSVAVTTDQRPIRGALEISTGYGASEIEIDVGIVDDPTPDIPVDDTLGAPSPEPSTESRPLARLLATDDLPVLALGAVALALAVVAATTIADPVVLVGALVVLAGVATAGYVLLTDAD
jgi:hypothetical protein